MTESAQIFGLFVRFFLRKTFWHYCSSILQLNINYLALLEFNHYNFVQKCKYAQFKLVFLLNINIFSETTIFYEIVFTLVTRTELIGAYYYFSLFKLFYGILDCFCT